MLRTALSWISNNQFVAMAGGCVFAFTGKNSSPPPVSNCAFSRK
jgi:hypothetical protein